MVSIGTSEENEKRRKTAKMLKSKLERISWRERGDYRFRKPLSEEMLSPTAGVYIENCRLRNQSLNCPKEIREIVYDSDYVAAKISKDVFERLKVKNWDSIEWILKAAWEYYKWDDFNGKSEDSIKK